MSLIVRSTQEVIDTEGQEQTSEDEQSVEHDSLRHQGWLGAVHRLPGPIY